MYVISTLGSTSLPSIKRKKVSFDKLVNASTIGGLLEKGACEQAIRVGLCFFEVSQCSSNSVSVCILHRGYIKEGPIWREAYNPSSQYLLEWWKSNWEDALTLFSNSSNIVFFCILQKLALNQAVIFASFALLVDVLRALSKMRFSRLIDVAVNAQFPWASFLSKIITFNQVFSIGKPYYGKLSMKANWEE